jgi:hypothetical protein
MLWGCEIQKGGWKRLIRAAQLKNTVAPQTVLAADWSQFDRRALHSIIDDVHNIWKSFIDFSGLYQPTNLYPDASTAPWRLENLWKWMTYNVKHYPIALPSGDVYQWTTNGIASGYQQTQLLDSWVNGIKLLTVLSEHGANIESPLFFFKLQGDDSICSFHEPFFYLYGERFKEMIAKSALKRFNAKLSPEKTKISESFQGQYVLGYFNRDGFAYKTDVDLMSHLLFPERPQSLEATLGTSIGIAIAAMGCSRDAYNVCQDVYDYITREHTSNTRFGPSTAKYFRHVLGLDVFDEVPTFPTFMSTWLQNFILVHRDESQSQRLWPTDPKRSPGI